MPQNKQHNRVKGKKGRASAPSRRVSSGDMKVAILRRETDPDMLSTMIENAQNPFDGASFPKMATKEKRAVYKIVNLGGSRMMAVSKLIPRAWTIVDAYIVEGEAEGVTIRIGRVR